MTADGAAAALKMGDVITSKLNVASRLSPQLAEKVLVLLKTVPTKQRRPHQQLLAETMLNFPGREQLVCDIIRFIIRCWHPSNKVLASDIVQRYVVIGWLYELCGGDKGGAAARQARDAIYFDWFFHRPRENIMLVEPGALLIANSLSGFATLASAQILHLCDMAAEFLSGQERVREGILVSWREAHRLRVVAKPASILGSSYLDPGVVSHALRGGTIIAWRLTVAPGRTGGQGAA